MKPNEVRRRARGGVGRRGAGAPVWVVGDPEAVRPLVRGEGMPVFVAAVFLALVALAVCYRQGWTLLYGDAVAHLGNARRILDARYPALGQLGGVWLPLPHLLMLPFVNSMAMWQTGLAAAPMSMLSYAASVVGVWRLGRRMMRLRWALVATTLYALNPNLLYVATTALTEALFLALFVWSVVAAVECVAALEAGNAALAGRRMVFAGVMVLLEVFTRYDGWVMGAAVWCCLAWAWWRSEAVVRRRVGGAFGVFTLLCVAGPLLWFWYNAHFDGDWLDFMRGPYSAKAIERTTAKGAGHYPGWHNPVLAVEYFARVAQIDAAAWELGFGLMAAAVMGAWLSWRRRGAERMGLLLWLPLPFYGYSIAFGSVPVFLPQLPPHAFYNVRYGMELLPALCVYGAVAAEWMDVWLRGWRPRVARWWQPAAMVVCALNAVMMMAGLGSAEFLRGQAARQRQLREALLGGYVPAARRWAYPLVLQEGLVNAATRVPFEQAVARALQTIPADEPVLMSVTAHVGAVEDAGRPLKSMVSEGDEQTWRAALADPARRAAYVIAMEGDAVAKAVAAHPEGLLETEVIRSSGQPVTRVYQSTVWKPEATR